MSRFGHRLRGTTPVGSWLGGSSVQIKSIQYGSIALGAVASGTATISAVSLADSVLISLGSQSAHLEAIQFCGRIALTNATTVTLTRVGTTDVSMVHGFAVLEFQSGVIRRRGQGTITIPDAANSATATIGAVTMAKTMLLNLGQSFNTTGTQPSTYWDCRLALTDATTITASRGGNTAGLNPTVGYYFVEFA